MGEYYLYTSRDKTEYIVRLISLDNISFIKADGSQKDWFKNFKLEVEFINDSIYDLAEEVELDKRTGDLVYKDTEKTTKSLTTEEVIQKLQIARETEQSKEA